MQSSWSRGRFAALALLFAGVSPAKAMDFSVLESSPDVFVEAYGGQLAGLDNVILHPRLTAGVAERLRFNFAPQWRNALEAYGIYGSAETGAGKTSENLQEVRGSASSLYTFYKKDEALRFSGGFYSEYAVALHDYPPYSDPGVSAGYAREETEKLTREVLLGGALDLDASYDRLASSFHTVIFGSGTRIGPNLLAYKPLLEFDWFNRAYLIGTADDPKLDFFAGTRFWLARKDGVQVINGHDGLGGTKRELYLTYGLDYYFNRSTRLYAQSYGYNNINRGDNSSVPFGFRDGFVLGLRYSFRHD